MFLAFYIILHPWKKGAAEKKDSDFGSSSIYGNPSMLIWLMASAKAFDQCHMYTHSIWYALMLFSDEAGFGGFGCRVFTGPRFCWGQDLAPQRESER